MSGVGARGGERRCISDGSYRLRWLGGRTQALERRAGRPGACSPRQQSVQSAKGSISTSSRATFATLNFSSASCTASATSSMSRPTIGFGRRTRRNLRNERRWHARGDGVGVGSGRRARRLYFERRDAALAGRRRSGGRDRAARSSRCHRRLQEKQGSGGAAGRAHGRRAPIFRPSSSIRQRRSARATFARRRPAVSSSKRHRAGCRPIVDTGLNLVHVDDVAAGHLAALAARAYRRALHSRAART